MEYDNHQFSIEDSEETDSSLLFFKINKNKYKLLGVIVKTILCTPSSSVPSECLFSNSGLTSTELRTSLKTVNLKNCVFYKVNKKYFSI